MLVFWPDRPQMPHCIFDTPTRQMWSFLLLRLFLPHSWLRPIDLRRFDFDDVKEKIFRVWQIGYWNYADSSLFDASHCDVSYPENEHLTDGESEDAGRTDLSCISGTSKSVNWHRVHTYINNNDLYYTLCKGAQSNPQLSHFYMPFYFPLIHFRLD